MDANEKNEIRDTVEMVVAGRKTKLYRPTTGQITGLMMIQSEQIADMVKLEVITELYLALFFNDEDRGWFVRQLCLNKSSIEEMTQTLLELYGVDSKDEKPAAKKSAARRR